MAKIFRGTFTALATPFTEDSAKVDFQSLSNLIEFQIRHNVNGLVSCGSTGEAQTLNINEYKEVVKFTAEQSKGRASIVAGIGTNDTREACCLAEFISEIDSVSAILVVAPPYNKPPQRGIISHFKKIKMCAPNKEIIAYNIPGRTSVNITPETIINLYKERIITGVKESSGNLNTSLEIVSAVGDDFSLLSGEDSMVLALMVHGGVGVISATANIFPDIFVSITSNALKGDFKKAKISQLRVLPIIKAMFLETNPIPLKYALFLKKLIKYPSVRLPLEEPLDDTKKKIQKLLGIDTDA